MKISQFTTFAATFVLGSVAIAALAVPNPSVSQLTGGQRAAIGQLAGITDAQRTALDDFNSVVEADYPRASKALGKTANAIAKLDKAFAGASGYDEQADFMVSLVNTGVGTQMGLSASAAVADDIIAKPRSALRFARIAKKNARVLGGINLSDAKSKISRAKSRKKQFKLMSKAAKYFEKLIKRYGKNNPSTGF